MNKRVSMIITLITLVILFLSVYLFSDKDKLEIVLKEAKPSLLLWAVFCMFLYWFMQSILLKQLLNNRGEKISFRSAFRLQMIGEFFGAITPLATGGQPIQVMYLANKNIQPGKSTAVLGIHLFYYHIARVLIALILTIIYSRYFFIENTSIRILLSIGLVVNFLVGIFMLFAGVKPEPIKKFAKKIIDLLARFKIVKNKDRVLNKTSEEINNFSNSINVFKQQKISIMLLILIETVVYLTVYFLATIFIIKSLGIKVSSVALLIACQASVSLISAYVPLPGGSLGAEGAFYLIFSGILPANAPLFLILFIWRILTYYLTLFIGFLFALKI